jgi:hypothetical protein
MDPLLYPRSHHGQLEAVRFHSIILVAAAIVACGVASFAAPAPAAISAFLPNRTFGLGEQQVYVIERDQSVVVRYRDVNGDPVTKTLTRSDSHSVALTVEAYASDGAAVLGVAVEAPLSPSGSPPQSSAQSSPAPDSLALASASPAASPMVGVNGAITAPGPLVQLAGAALIVGTQPSEPLADGSKWNSGGLVALPMGAVNIRLANTAAAWSEDPTVLQVTSAGTLDASGTVDVEGFGKVALRGNGTCGGVSFIDMKDALLIGASFTVASRGNAVNAHGGVGQYTLNSTYKLALARYIPGRMPLSTLPPSAIPGFAHNASPDTGVITQGAADQLAHPAPTDNIFGGSPPPVVTPTPMPEQSMPPVPIPVSSGASLASPPAPPPTPIPTFTPH